MYIVCNFNKNSYIYFYILILQEKINFYVLNFTSKITAIVRKSDKTFLNYCETH